MYEFGVDFIARCLAGEAIGEAKKKQWKLILRKMNTKPPSKRI